MLVYVGKAYGGSTLAYFGPNKSEEKSFKNLIHKNTTVIYGGNLTLLFLGLKYRSKLP
jgi:hypothetical protein